jgi:hypothetical protein
MTRGIGTALAILGLAALLWACMADLAIAPSNGLAANLHWAGTRDRSMVWGFGLLVVGLLMRIATRRRPPPDPEAPTIATHTRCPACAELVRREASKCKHCGSTLVPQQQHQQAAPSTASAAPPRHRDTPRFTGSDRLPPV